jgi:hypothetical protein
MISTLPFDKLMAKRVLKVILFSSEHVLDTWRGFAEIKIIIISLLEKRNYLRLKNECRLILYLKKVCTE